MNASNVTAAIETRKSVRVYLERPVAEPLLREILELARLSPSGGNLQPCKVYALTGEVRQTLCDTVMERCMANPAGEPGDIPIYPDGLQEPWRSRRLACGELMYDALRIPREDKLARLGQVMKNFAFFDAPVGMLFTMDLSLSRAQLVDVGILMQSVMLLARERGLATCPQASWAMWPDTVREVLGLDNNVMVLAGMALGYAKEDEPVNSMQQPRVPPAQSFSIRGF